MISEEEWNEMLTELSLSICEDLKEEANLTEEEFSNVVQEAARRADMFFHSPCFWEEIKPRVRLENMMEFVEEIGKAIISIEERGRYSPAEEAWGLKVIILVMMVKSLVSHFVEILKQKGEIGEVGCHLDWRDKREGSLHYLG